MRTGRPFRFLGVVFGGWVGLRVLVLWPGGDLPIVAPRMIGRAAAKPVRFSPIHPVPMHRAESDLRAATSGRPSSLTGDQPRPTITASASLAVAGSSSQTAPHTAPSSTVTSDETEEGPSIIPQISSDADRSSRWGGSVWAIARSSGPTGGLGSSQLGGAQAGAWITYALGEARRVALVGRVATPLEGRGREAALGVEVRVPGAPVRLFAERRFALDDGARGGPSIGVIAGVDRRLGGTFRLEAYGQAGAIERDGLEGFADGAARVTRSLADVSGIMADAGAGAWGGAQRGAERLDVGPTVGVSLPVGERRIRATLDYRIRIAGEARPGSGPALSLGTDF